MFVTQLHHRGNDRAEHRPHAASAGYASGDRTL
jgi:hypothetical protein